MANEKKPYVLPTIGKGPTKKSTKGLATSLGRAGNSQYKAGANAKVHMSYGPDSGKTISERDYGRSRSAGVQNKDPAAWDQTYNGQGKKPKKPKDGNYMLGRKIMARQTGV